MFGFINLHKPSGWTSHDCVARVRRILKTKRVGHGGTLDPLATGVLPIAIGSATRLLQFLPTAKAYRATIRLGLTTTTDDLAGEVLQVRSAGSVTQAQLSQVLKSFQGTLQQVPPIYSAIQVNGQRLYKLARQGAQVQPEPRTIEVHSIEILDWQTYNPEQPEVTLVIACGPGTYIRSIARDLGEVLHTGGTLVQLVRIRSCGFDLANSISVDVLEDQAAQSRVMLIDPVQALQDLPYYVLNDLLATHWCQGRSIEVDPGVAESWVRVYDGAEHFLGMGLLSKGLLLPKIVLAQSAGTKLS